MRTMRPVDMRESIEREKVHFTSGATFAKRFNEGGLRARHANPFNPPWGSNPDARVLPDAWRGGRA
jgi:hypothetical protein